MKGYVDDICACVTAVGIYEGIQPQESDVRRYRHLMKERQVPSEMSVYVPMASPSSEMYPSDNPQNKVGETNMQSIYLRS